MIRLANIFYISIGPSVLVYAREVHDWWHHVLVYPWSPVGHRRIFLNEQGEILIDKKYANIGHAKSYLPKILSTSLKCSVWYTCNTCRILVSWDRIENNIDFFVIPDLFQKQLQFSSLHVSLHHIWPKIFVIYVWIPIPDHCSRYNPDFKKSMCIPYTLYCLAPDFILIFCNCLYVHSRQSRYLATFCVVTWMEPALGTWCWCVISSLQSSGRKWRTSELSPMSSIHSWGSVFSLSIQILYAFLILQNISQTHFNDIKPHQVYP